MGNYITVTKIKRSPISSNVSGKGKVILLDGTIFVFDEPTTVAELMLEHPQQVVVELTSNKGTTLTQKSRRPSPLPADKKLETKKVYMMLPIRRGKVASLSSEEARHVLFRANKVLRSRASLFSFPRLLPLFERICPVGGGEGDNGKFVVENNSLEINVDDDDEERIEVAPEYLTRQVSGKGWKPSLDTIKEKNLDIRQRLF